MVKKWGKRISLAIGLVAFFVSAGFITKYVTRVCIPYTAKADKIEKTLYSDDEDMNAVDVCLIGGSHGNNAFNPNIMWKTAGIHAYNYCYAGETIALTKVYLEELFKKRKFELVVLDIYYAGVADRYFGEKDYAFDVLNKMRDSEAKSDYVDKHVREDVRKDYRFSLNRYHSRWLELSDQDFDRKPDPSDDWMLGQDYHWEVNDGTTVSFPAWADQGQVVGLKNDVEQELRDVIELVQSHGAKIVLVDIPRRMCDSLFPTRFLKNEYAVVNRVREIAAEYGVDVIQYDDEKLAEIGFVPEEHMYNRGHMNITGSEIYSAALAKELVSRYPITTYPEVASDIWEGYYVEYSKQKENHPISSSSRRSSASAKYAS